MIKLISQLLSLSLILLSHTSHTVAAPLIESEKFIIQSAWIAEAPPVSKVMVAYLIISNLSAEDIEIVGAKSESFSSIEFHETLHKNGMARMIRHRSLNLPANDEISLKRGAKHLMLFNPSSHFKAGEIINITFSTKNHGDKTIAITVKKAQY